MTMENQNADANKKWNKFYKTGSVADYLSYLIAQNGRAVNTVANDTNGLNLKDETDADKNKGLGAETPKYW